MHALFSERLYKPLARAVGSAMYVDIIYRGMALKGKEIKLDTELYSRRSVGFKRQFFSELNVAHTSSRVQSGMPFSPY